MHSWEMLSLAAWYNMAGSGLVTHGLDQSFNVLNERLLGRCRWRDIWIEDGDYMIIVM
jgi:translation initiation factor IF-1